MQFRLQFRIGAALLASLAIICASASGQRGPRPTQLAAEAPPAQSSPARPRVAKPFPPRAVATDYQAHAQAGSVTIGAELDGNSVPTPDATYTTDSYVTVEVGMFGAAGQKVMLSLEDFSLRLNGKKQGNPPQPYELLFKSLKDPEWVPPDKEEKSSSKGGINTGGKDQDAVPLVVHMPPEMQRAMEQNVKNSAFPEGERALPVAGLLHFSYGGNVQKLKSVELIYTGAAGKATLTLK